MNQGVDLKLTATDECFGADWTLEGSSAGMNAFMGGQLDMVSRGETGRAALQCVSGSGG
jgi:hypothetical protein